jgi:glycosyltransferase involved in cell wall biosynthesis
MKKVFHFVPSLDIGGVEIAIKKSLPDLKQKLDISVFYVKRPGSLDAGQMPWWRSLKNIFVDRPDIVVTSLWWAHPLGFLFKLAGIRWACFIHNSRFANFVDRLVCIVSIRLSDEIAADSDQAAAFVCSIKKTANVCVIPYIFPLPQSAMEVERIRNRFIYVGRNAKEKRMDLVVGFFKHLLTSFSSTTCRFVIAGDVPMSVLNLMKMFGKRVTVESNLSNSEVFNRLCASEYFIVLSDLEGFCMTAYEAVQAGCFVIYRDVGEIKKYVIPKQSLRVISLETLCNQFDEIFAKRNEIILTRIDNAEPKLRSDPSATYTSHFMALIEGNGW